MSVKHLFLFVSFTFESLRWIPLSTNRFASHVCQTLLTLGVDTISREVNKSCSIVNVCLLYSRLAVFSLQRQKDPIVENFSH